MAGFCSKDCTEGLVSGNLCDCWLHKGQAGGIYGNVELLEEEEEAELLKVSTISFIQTKQQHSFAPFMFLSMTVSVKVITMNVIQEP